MNNDINSNNDNLEKTNVIEIPDEEVNISKEDNSSKNNNESSNEVMTNNETVVETTNIPPAITENTNSSSETIINSDQDKKVVSDGFEKVNNGFYEKDKKVWPYVLLFFVFVIAGLFCYYYFVLTKPINVINKLFNNVYSEVKTSANKSIKGTSTEINSISFDGNLILTSEMEELKSLSGLNINASLGYDLKENKNNYIDFNASLKENKLLDFQISFIENKIYYNLKDAYSKIVYVQNDESLDGINSINIDKSSLEKNVNDILYILEKSKDTIVKNISQDKLSKKIMLKEIDGKKIPVVEVMYNLDFKEVKKLRNALLDAYINDNRILDFISKNEGMEVSELKVELINEKDNFTELDYAGNTEVVIDIDVFSNKLVNLNVKKDNLSFSIREKGNEINIEFKSDKFGSISLTVDTKENKFFTDIKIIENEKVNRIAITAKVNEESKTKSDMTLTAVVYDTEDINKEILSLSGKFKTELNQKIEPINIDGAVNLESLNESEITKFQEALLPIMGLLSDPGSIINN